MNDATRAAQPILHPITQRPPVNFGYPLGGIAGRIAIGLVLLAVGGIVLQRSGMLWLTGGTLLVVLGGLTAVSNLLALLNADRRRIIVDIDGVEIRYGFSRRRYRFLDYSDYRISRVGLRHFLTALPIDVKHVLGKRVEHVRITVQDRPALLTPTRCWGAVRRRLCWSGRARSTISAAPPSRRRVQRR